MAILPGNFSDPPIIREIHLGGGTPTFFQPANLRHLLESILEQSQLHPKKDFGFEGSPNNTTTEHLKVLHQLGFRRVSLGVQDFDPKVQKAVNRIHDFRQVQKVVDTARSIGYNSINLDLIYGLPFQTEDSMSKTLDLVGQLLPDRIAFYSYAHVPWKSPSQRGYSETDLPVDSAKRKLYEMAKSRFMEAGYREIGMDHFALKTDDIAIAHESGTLHRNFMGYTVSQTDLLIGLGVSAISDTKTAYAQNEKTVEQYQQQISDRGLALSKGHFLTDRDQMVRDTILPLICNERTTIKDDLLGKNGKETLTEMQQEGLVEVTNSYIKVTESGKPFIRNICSVFDHYMKRESDGQQIFSKAI